MGPPSEVASPISGSTMKVTLVLVLLSLLGWLAVECKLLPIEFRIPLAGNVPPPGTPWPKPQSIRTTNRTFSIDPRRLVLSSPLAANCIVLENALRRYADLMVLGGNTGPVPHQTVIEHVKVEVQQPGCQYPGPNHDESYSIEVPHGAHAHEALVHAKSVWGALRGLETLSQLVYSDEHNQLMINESEIHDHPRYKYRGVLLDTARHYLPMKVILANLDAMAYNKFNVFHWHIVDDQSFPYFSTRYPNLTDHGAYTPRHIYTQEDVQDVIEYARMRGIRVIPEIDSPGHSHAMARAFPDLLTPCYGKEDTPFTPLYPKFAATDVLNPTKPHTFQFMKNLFHEFKSLFKDQFIHLGMDEVSYECWKSNPHVAQFMVDHNMTVYNHLEQYYVERTLENVRSVGYKYIMYQDPVDNGVKLANDSIVLVWKDTSLDKTMDKWENYISRVAKHNYQMVLSACWYLNYINYPYPGMDWEKYYLCDPRNFPGTEHEKNLVIGGEACIWGEFVDQTNLLSRLWPRASAVAERLWSNAAHTKDVDSARHRLDQHRCRMLRRGIPAAPILNGYCGDWEVQDSDRVKINPGDRVQL